MTQSTRGSPALVKRVRAHRENLSKLMIYTTYLGSNYICTYVDVYKNRQIILLKKHVKLNLSSAE
jgi:hypothetical protein